MPKGGRLPRNAFPPSHVRPSSSIPHSNEDSVRKREAVSTELNPSAPAAKNTTPSSAKLLWFSAFLTFCILFVQPLRFLPEDESAVLKNPKSSPLEISVAKLAPVIKPLRGVVFPEFDVVEGIRYLTWVVILNTGFCHFPLLSRLPPFLNGVISLVFLEFFPWIRSEKGEDVDGQPLVQRIKQMVLPTVDSSFGPWQALHAFAVFLLLFLFFDFCLNQVASVLFPPPRSVSGRREFVKKAHQ